MNGGYLLNFGPRTAHAARDLAAAVYPELALPELPGGRGPPTRPRANDGPAVTDIAVRPAVRWRAGRSATAIAVAALFVVVAAILSLAVGPVAIAPSRVIAILLHGPARI